LPFTQRKRHNRRRDKDNGEELARRIANVELLFVDKRVVFIEIERLALLSLIKSSHV